VDLIRISKIIESETLHLPELKPLIGKTVEIIVRDKTVTTPEQHLYDAFFALAGQDVVDPEAYKRLRAASMT
jgi:hypothetical protein